MRRSNGIDRKPDRLDREPNGRQNSIRDIARKGRYTLQGSVRRWKTSGGFFLFGNMRNRAGFPGTCKNHLTAMSLNYRNGSDNGRAGAERMSMKNKLYRALQIFAEGEGSGTPGEPGGNDPGAGSGTPTQTEPLSFDDFLSQEGNQAEFDRRVQKAIKTAVSNAQEKWKTLTDDKVSEAEKLSQMTAEQKEKYRADKAEKELADLRR